MPEVSDLLARAFDDDPFVNFLVKHDARRAERVKALMRLVLEKYTVNLEETYVTDGFEGAASWNAPGRRPHGLLTDLRALPGLIAGTGYSGLLRAIRAFDQAEKKHPKEPHYYLQVIGVIPEQQGRGIGTQLLAPVLARADAEGIPAYLESSKEQNLPLYERHGFRVVEEMQLQNGGPRIWRMWRDAQ